MKREKNYFEKGTGAVSFSLLAPPGVSPNVQNSTLEINPSAAHDLGLDELIAVFAAGHAYHKEIRTLFYRLPCNPDVISYRQAVLDDLLANPELVERFTTLLPVIDSLFEHTRHSRTEMSWLYEVVRRAEELQNMIDCFEGMGLSLGPLELHSEGLRRLQEEVRAARNDPKYQRLTRELPEMLAKLEGTASITIGVNLDSRLRPVQAALLSVNEKRFTDQSFLGRLLGVNTGQAGIAPLHSVPQQAPELSGPVDPLMVPLFADLAKVLEKTAIPIAEQLGQYADLHADLFTGLRQALIFYLGAVRFIRQLEDLRLPMCRPQIAPAEEGRCMVIDSYNVHLALRQSAAGNAQPAAIVMNDILIGPDGQILILTGPNGGGKTTYMQGAGVVHILAQLGCHVPGKQATISPLDQLLTHFPLEEKPETGTGRFGEEAIRLRQIFERVTRQSLVLLNESLSSTNLSESLYLARDIVRILRRIGTRAIYSTHLHELAADVEELNRSVPGDSTIISVVSSPIDGASPATDAEGRNRYKLERRPPLGQSYAREIAARYGISYQQLEHALAERGVL